MNYLEELNEVQLQAVTCIKGPLMVIAGAGSGKTKVLTYRIAHLLEQGVDAFNILSLTFTNKAAKEMKERIARILGGSEAKNLWMGTFHSVFAKILRIEAEKLGYPTNFTIYDTDDSKSLIKTIIKEMNLDDKIYKPNMVLGRISSAKNNLISPASYLTNTDIQSEDRQSGRPKIGEIYGNYHKRCFKAGAMDFDDLLYQMNVLLRDFPEVLHKYQHKFKYILVDEYQDTNYSQYLIVKKLAALNENICVVGDDAQSIYSFRGANIQNILNFKKDYPDLKTFKLEQNYRSTQNIVNAANSIIAKNKDQLKKEVWTQNESGDKIEIFKALTDNEEGLQVARSIFELRMNEQCKESDFAILYRTNAQSRAMEEALRKLNISYRIYGGLSFYKRKEIKDLLAYFRLAVNNNDEEALKRILNYPIRGIGQSTEDKIIAASNDYDRGLWFILENISELKIGINGGITGKIEEFVTMIKSFTSGIQTETAYELGYRIAVSSGILKDLFTDRTPEGVSRHENIQELLNGLKDFSEVQNQDKTRTLDEFIQDIALLTDSDEDEADKNQPKVSLMTIHAAKGLEFPYVYVVGLEENLFPSQLSLNSRENLEEERRLFYVALTRACKKAFITYSITRYRWGNLINCEPSRFIEEIDPALIEMPAARAYLGDKGASERPGRIFNRSSQLEKPAPKPNNFSGKTLVKVSDSKSNSDFIADDTSNLKEGMEVEHQRFGTGKVLNIEGSFPNQKATVYFDTAGQKDLLLKFARLKILN
ncbi:MAG: UvrD-helicase domain-containing protein [Bacteroidetes bacterium]|nr:UvrD-helicase domain-containing protein [Bacteroidota bacterium]HET6245787.1 UvrD-helicase domain-containing protein [Bacteroidia bacterium]